MNFNLGQKVVFLKEKGGGVIRSINEKGRYLVEDEHGFIVSCLGSEIGVVHSDDYQIEKENEFILKDEALKLKVDHITHKSKKSIKYADDIWEIDLHSHNIMETERGLSNTDIFLKQMSTFRIFFGQARSKSIRNIVVIHGVGEGVLKSEIRTYLDRIDGVKYYDADFKSYGKGATAVEISYEY